MLACAHCVRVQVLLYVCTRVRLLVYMYARVLFLTNSNIAEVIELDDLEEMDDVLGGLGMSVDEIAALKQKYKSLCMLSVRTRVTCADLYAVQSFKFAN